MQQEGTNGRKARQQRKKKRKFFIVGLQTFDDPETTQAGRVVIHQKEIAPRDAAALTGGSFWEWHTKSAAETFQQPPRMSAYAPKPKIAEPAATPENVTRASPSSSPRTESPRINDVPANTTANTSRNNAGDNSPRRANTQPLQRTQQKAPHRRAFSEGTTPAQPPVVAALVQPKSESEPQPQKPLPPGVHLQQPHPQQPTNQQHNFVQRQAPVSFLQQQQAGLQPLPSLAETLRQHLQHPKQSQQPQHCQQPQQHDQVCVPLNRDTTSDYRPLAYAEEDIIQPFSKEEITFPQLPTTFNTPWSFSPSTTTIATTTTTQPITSRPSPLSVPMHRKQNFHASIEDDESEESEEHPPLPFSCFQSAIAERDEEDLCMEPSSYHDFSSSPSMYKNTNVYVQKQERSRKYEKEATPRYLESKKRVIEDMREGKSQTELYRQEPKEDMLLVPLQRKSMGGQQYVSWKRKKGLPQQQQQQHQHNQQQQQQHRQSNSGWLERLAARAERYGVKVPRDMYFNRMRDDLSTFLLYWGTSSYAPLAFNSENGMPMHIIKPVLHPAVHSSPRSSFLRLGVNEAYCNLFGWTEEELLGPLAGDPHLLQEEAQLTRLRLNTIPFLFRKRRLPRSRQAGQSTSTVSALMMDEEEDDEEDEAASPVFFLDPKYVTKDGRILHCITQNKVFYDERGFPTLIVCCIERVVDG